METNTEFLKSEIFKQLFTIAARDGIVTSYERAIIDQVAADVKEDALALELAAQDGEIDAYEKRVLQILVHDIEQGAIDTMMEDGTINRHEEVLILKLQKLLKHYFS